MVISEVFDNRLTGRLVADAVLRLFEADGTIYLATGYFTWSGYLTIQEALIDFLARSPENEVHIVVSTGADQFSQSVAEALWDLDYDDRLQLLTYRDGFIHPKLYLRDGPEPALAMGSANLTWDGLGKNLELIWYYEPEEQDVVFTPHLAWIKAFVAASTPITPADLRFFARVRKTSQTWGNKGRINLPLVFRRSLPLGKRFGINLDDELEESAVYRRIRDEE